MSDLDHYLTDEMTERARRVLVDAGADSEGGWHSWRCFDRDRYPEPCDCTAEIARASLSAVLPDIIRQAKAEAWEEGHAAGCTDPYARYGECGCGPNPYREGAES